MTHATPAAIAASRAPLERADFEDVVGDGRPLSRLEIVATSASTNTALVGLVTSQPDGWGALSGYVADHQTAGRGRAGRSWATPARAALTGSYVLRPAVSRAEYGWAPLVVGLATVRALRRMGVGAFLKWPNDVVVEHGARDIPEWGRWRKVVGILCEAVPDQDAIVAGIGINVSQDASELPVPHAASLATLGAASLDRVALLRALVAELRDAVAAWERGDDIPALVTAACATIGWDVAVDVPAGPNASTSPVTGTAIGLTASGGLLVRTANGDQEVLAGDVRVRRA
ncbi:biotin--[acetyl-CoA-carboxylase] ligase [Demequina sp.]|uniref:biotin--[acetyl-CoA-carboxylase] ligase n=1 Tax=Demequina sp. TaxID=2050685 RepID=UPI003D1372F4